MIYLSFIIIALYICYVLIDSGIPNSLSATYYKYGKMFSIVLLSSAILLMPKLLEFLPNNVEFLGFLSLAGVIAVAVSPDFRNDKLTDRIHDISAVLALIISQILVILINPLLLLDWIPIVLYIIIGGIKYKTLNVPYIKFLGEVIMILTIYQMLL